MNSISSIFGALMLIVVVFYGMQVIGDEVIGNSNLDNTSIILIGNISNELNQELNYSTDFNEFETNLSQNSTFDSEDVFAREFLEGRNEGNTKQGVIARAIKIPELVRLSLGVPRAAVAWIYGILITIITTILAFALYRAVFGSGKVTER